MLTAQKSGNFYNLCFNSSDFDLGCNNFLHFLVHVLPLGSRFMDRHICADLDPDPISQNLDDPTDPDPKHWKMHISRFKY